MTKITEVLSVSSAASADKEMPGEGIRISTDTIYRLRLISVAGWFANNAELWYTRARTEQYLEFARQMPIRLPSFLRDAPPPLLNNGALKKKPALSSSLSLARSSRGEKRVGGDGAGGGACRRAAGALRSSLVQICAGSDL